MKKNVLSYITALSLLFLNGTDIKNVKAQSTDNIKTEISEGETIYVPLPIDTIFNSKSNVDIAVDQRFFLASFIGGEFITPAYAHTYEPINNDEKNDFEGPTVSLSYLKNFFEINDSFLYNNYQVVFEYTSDTPVFMADLKGKTIAVNNNYFKELMNISKYSELKEISFFEIVELVEYYVEDDSDKDYILNSREMKSIPEYLETIYKKYVPIKYWPVNFEYKKTINNNSNLPILKNEILDSSFNDYKILLIYSDKEESYDDPYMVSIIKKHKVPNENRAYYYDLYTNEFVDHVKNIVPYKNQEEHIKAIIAVSKDTNISSTDSLTNVNLSNMINKMIWDTTTVREVVELYEQLPLEYQIDYSYFDFSKSPNVVQEQEVKPGSKDFKIDYDNNILYAIDKPKSKELVKKS